MPLRRVSLVLPSHQLADLGLDYDGDLAANFLAVWTSLWHPALLAATGTTVTVRAVDSLFGQPDLEGELVLIPRLTEADDTADWRTTLDADTARRVPALGHLTNRDAVLSTILAAADLTTTSVDRDTARDFLAFGYAVLQVDMLTRVMRYGSLVTDAQLISTIVAAARDAVAGRSIDDSLAAAYDQLTQLRNNYYPVDFHLIDVTLTAAGLLGESLASTVQSAVAANLLITGDLADGVVDQHPATHGAIKAAITDKRLELLGGVQLPGPLAAHEPEQLLAQLTQGRTALERLGQKPPVFAHFEGVVAPLVPVLVDQLAYRGILVTSFDGSPLPPLYPPRCQWQGLDGTTNEALSVAPLDRGDPGTMLRLADHIARAMDSDLVATLLLAGWPGHECETFGDLRRVAQRSEVLGRFELLSKFFDTTTSADRVETLAAYCYAPAAAAIAPIRDPEVPAGLLRLAMPTASDTRAALLQSLGLTAATEADATGWLFVNASSRPTCHVAGRVAHRDVPAGGFLWQPCELPAPKRPLADLPALSNELLQVACDPATGGITRVELYRTRGNQLSQKLMLLGASELQLAIDPLDQHTSDALTGAIRANFRLVDRTGTTIGNVRQTTIVHRRSGEIAVRIEIDAPAATLPSGARLACRVAWPDHSAQLTQRVGGVELPIVGSRIGPTAWVGMHSVSRGLAIVSSQPLMHRRCEDNQLETTIPWPPSGSASVELRFQLARIRPACPAPAGIAIPTRGTPVQDEGWWLHLSSAQILVTAIEHVEGTTFRLRLLETVGQSCECRIECWCPIEHARRVGLGGRDDEAVAIADGAAVVAFAPFEYTAIELRCAGG